MKKIKEFIEVLESFYDELQNEEFYIGVMAFVICLLVMFVFVLFCLAILW
jgi:hypothetical protein